MSDVATDFIAVIHSEEFARRDLAIKNIAKKNERNQRLKKGDRLKMGCCFFECLKNKQMGNRKCAEVWLQK